MCHCREFCFQEVFCHKFVWFPSDSLFNWPHPWGCLQMNSEKQGPSFYLSVLGYNFCVFLPLIKERRKEIEGVQEHFFQWKNVISFQRESPLAQILLTLVHALQFSFLFSGCMWGLFYESISWAQIGCECIDIHGWKKFYHTVGGYDGKERREEGVRKVCYKH